MAAANRPFLAMRLRLAPIDNSRIRSSVGIGRQSKHGRHWILSMIVELKSEVAMKMSVSLSLVALVSALTGAGPLAAQASTPGAAAPANQEIVVRGRSLRDTAADLKACLARRCPPDADARASLAHAENLFVGGNYGGARTTLKASIGRNKRYGKQYPEPVSDLLRANSRIAEHMGEAKDFQLSVLAMRDTLRGAYGASDFRALVAQVEVGDSRAKLGFPDEAEGIYRDVEKRALTAGQNRVATLARLRLATLDGARFADTKDEIWRKRVDERLDQVINRPLGGAEEFVMVGEVMRAKLDRAAGRADSTSALVAKYAARGGVSRPLLLFSEPIERIDLATGVDGQATPNTLLRLTAAQSRGEWADVGYWVEPDGTVDQIEILRHSGSKAWLKPVLANIGKRIYAPLRKVGDASAGFYMVERYTLTARFSDVGSETASHLRRREMSPRIERIDLTPDNYDPPAGKAAG